MSNSFSGIEPVGDRLLLRISVKEEAKKTKSGLLYLPPSQGNKRALKYGDVVAVGPDVTHYSVGDHVLYDQYAGTEIILNEGEPFLLIRDPEIMAKVHTDKL